MDKMLFPNALLELFNIIKCVLQKAPALVNAVQEIFMISQENDVGTGPIKCHPSVYLLGQ